MQRFLHWKQCRQHLTVFPNRQPPLFLPIKIQDFLHNIKTLYFPVSCLIPLLFSRCKDQHHAELDHSLLCSLALCTAEERGQALFPVKGHSLLIKMDGLCSHSAQLPLNAPGSQETARATEFQLLILSTHSFPLFLPFFPALPEGSVGWLKALPCCGQALIVPPGAKGRGGHSERCRLGWVYSEGFLWMQLIKIEINK